MTWPPPTTQRWNCPCGGKPWAEKIWWHPGDRRWLTLPHPDMAFDVVITKCPHQKVTA